MKMILRVNAHHVTGLANFLDSRGIQHRCMGCEFTIEVERRVDALAIVNRWWPEESVDAVPYVNPLNLLATGATHLEDA